MKFSKEERTRWLEDWRRSGKNAWTYARENGLVPQTFRGWVKREAEDASGFVEIPGRIKPKLEQPREILIEKGDVKIHLPMAVWNNGLRAVIESLGGTL